MNKPILCVDFDGTIHPYTKGWLGERVIDEEPPVSGFFEWLYEVSKHFQVCVYSSRSRYGQASINRMQNYLHRYRIEWVKNGGRVPHMELDPLVELQYPTEKPAAFLTIDDRALTFEGKWPALAQLQAFKPWNKREPS